jgi:uncharacterized protein involved in exopolysaccharide biosynthesis
VSDVNINCIEEDEIDLKELFETILKYKKQIATFVFVITFITLIDVILMPNSYKSSVVLAPQGSQKSVGGGLASLAAMAAVSIGGGDSGDPYVVLNTILDDNDFHSKVIQKYDLLEKLYKPKNLVYPFGLSFNKDEDIPENIDEAIFEATKKIKEILSLSQDKKSSMITLSATFYDRFLAKELVDIYLKELIEKVKKNDLEEIKKQIFYYKKELSSTSDISLKEQLSKSISALTQKVVFSNANEYYFVKKVTEPQVAYIKDKAKPKRALILVVAFITSLILAIFGVFFYEFIKNSDDKKVNS